MSGAAGMIVVRNGRSCEQVAASLRESLRVLFGARPSPGSVRRAERVKDIRCAVHAIRWAEARTDPASVWVGGSWAASWRAERGGLLCARCGKRPVSSLGEWCPSCGELPF